MADAKGTGKDKGRNEAAKQPSILVSIIVALALTLVAAGGGGVLGMVLADMIESPGPPKQEAEKPVAEKGEKPAHGGSAHGNAQTESAEPAEAAEEARAPLVLKPLQPIIANLATPAGAWIRIEGSLLLDAEEAKEADVLAAKIGEDILGFLRTVSLAQIEGASGYLHLREDLSDLVKFKSEGRVREFVMQSMVVE
jgi:flagellar FliL protein